MRGQGHMRIDFQHTALHMESNCSDNHLLRPPRHSDSTARRRRKLKKNLLLNRPISKKFYRRQRNLRMSKLDTASNVLTPGMECLRFLKGVQQTVADDVEVCQES